MKKYISFLGIAISLLPLSGCKTTTAKPDLKFLNTHTIYCRDIYGYVYPYEVSSYYFYTFSAYDLYGQFRYFDFFTNYQGLWIEACSGYPVYTFYNPNNPPTVWSVTSHYKIYNQPDASADETEPARGPSASITITATGAGTSGSSAASWGDIPAGSSVEGQFTIDGNAGDSYAHSVKIDPDNTIEERSETDNDNNGSIHIGRSTDDNTMTGTIGFKNVTLQDVKDLKTPYYIINCSTKQLELYNDGVQPKVPGYLR